MRILSTLLISLFIIGCGGEPTRKTSTVTTWPNGKPKLEHIQLKGDTIKVINYDSDGLIKSQGKMLGETREGRWYTYYPNGIKWSLNSFEGGIKHGEYKTWHRNGQLNISGHYTMGATTGKWMFYDSTGVVTKEFDVTPQN